MTSKCEDISELAFKYLSDSDYDSIDEIEREIARATADSRWDDLSKWHRVRLRYLRYRHMARLVPESVRMLN
jgi:hypothetical protein